jgi:SP family arabinose:H+ symporter-like MFS transporter
MHVEREPMKGALNQRFVVYLALTAGLGGLLFGFDIAIITGAGPFLTRHFGLGDLSLGWAFSSLLFGCVLGSFAAGRMTDRYGRKRMLVWVAALFALTSLATALAPNFTLFLLARFVGGLAVGAVSLLSPMYASEVSPPAIRGRMGTFYQLSIIGGVVVSYCINYLLRNAGADNWRYMFATGILPSMGFLLMIAFAPETPRYLARRGRMAEARALLKKIAGPDDVAAEAEAIERSLTEPKSTWKSLRRPGVKRALWASICLAILVQTSGINTIIDYAPSIFQSAGWKMDAALFSTFIVGITEFVFTVVAFWMIDRFGRKPLYIVGSLGMTASLAGLMIAAATGLFTGALALGLILVYLAFFCACVGPVFWTLVPEIFPNDVRALAMVVPVLLQWVFNALVVLLFPYAFHQIGKEVTFGFLASMSLAQGLFTWRLMPETKNKPLEEIERHWVELTR